jgi:hypothetical protein
MRNKRLIILFAGLILAVVACKKDEPVIVHSGLTRINYTVGNPLQMPHLEFTLNNTYDLSAHAACSVSLVANENSASLSLKIMLEDTEGNRTDQHPFVISEDEITKDDQTQTYTYDFASNLGSSTAITEGVNIHRIKKVLIYINSGIEGKVAEGFYWLDRVELSNP